MSTALEKFNRRVKQIKKQTGKSHRAAQKQASAENRSGRKPARVSGTKRKKARPAKKKAVGTAPKYKVIHEVRRIGSIDSMADVRHVARLQAKTLKEEMGWLMATRDSAKTKTDKRKLTKKIVEKRAQIQAAEKLFR